MSIHAEGLNKRYGDNQALHDVSFDVKPGEIFGIFGPNGAGKTTCLRVLTGLTKPDSGNSTVCGVDVNANPNAVRRHTSILVEFPFLYEMMKLKDYLKFYGKLSNVPPEQLNNKIDSLIKLVGMEKKTKMKLQTMSMGERQRAEIARVLLKPADVLFLDEPFNGIDLALRNKLCTHLRQLLEEGKCIFFTSHYLLEAEKLVDRFAFISKGKITAMGTSQDLFDKYLKPQLFINLKEAEKCLELLQGSIDFVDAEVEKNGIKITLKKKDDIPGLIRFLGTTELEIYEIRSLGNMEDVFDKVTKSPNEEVVE